MTTFKQHLRQSMKPATGADHLTGSALEAIRADSMAGTLDLQPYPKLLARLRLRPPRRVYWHYIAKGLARSYDALHTTAKSRLGCSKYVSGSFGTSPYKALTV